MFRLGLHSALFALGILIAPPLTMSAQAVSEKAAQITGARLPSLPSSQIVLLARATNPATAAAARQLSASVRKMLL